MAKEMLLTGKCLGCINKNERKISFTCLNCKRQYYPNMEHDPYETKPDNYTTNTKTGE